MATRRALPAPEPAVLPRRRSNAMDQAKAFEALEELDNFLYEACGALLAEERVEDAVAAAKAYRLLTDLLTDRLKLDWSNGEFEEVE